MPSLMELTRLMGEAPQDPSNPFLRQAMKGAQSEFIQPPPIDPTADTNRVSLSSGQSVSPFDAKLGPAEEAGPEQGVQNTGQGTGGFQNRHVLDNQEEEARPGFFKSDEFKNIANMGLGLLGGAAGGAIAGNWRAGMAGGGATQLQDFQQKQKDMLDRRHKGWEAAYNDSLSLPADIYTTPGMEEVAKAAQAIQKDLTDNGRVDNEQTMTNWLKVKAMYGGDIEKISMDRKMADQKRMEDEKFQNDAMRKSQRAEALQALVADNMTPPAQREAAAAELATIRQDLEMQKDRDATREAMAANQAADAQYRQSSLGLQQQGLGMQQKRLDQQDRISQESSTLRNSEANRRNFVNNWQKELSLRMKDGLASMDQAMGEQALAHKAEIVQMAGIQDVSGGNVTVNGQKIPLIQLIGDDPKLWDPDGTPNNEGWKVLLSDFANREISKPVEMPSRDLRLTDIGQ